MTKRTTMVILALLSALLGGVIAAFYYEMRMESRQAEAAVVGLSDHFNVIRALESSDVRGATKFLTTLADADVMQLMKVNGNGDRNPEYRRKVLTSYAQYRRKNPQFYQVPDYVDSTARPEYERNLKKIEQFLEQELSKPK